MKKVTLIFCCLLSATLAKGDSPLTSTFFAMAYNDVPVIGKIMQTRMSLGIYNIALTEEHTSFLDRNDVPLDQKVALINGLGWGEMTNVELYIQHLMKKYALPHHTLDSLLVLRDYGGKIEIWPAGKVISNHDLILLAYIQAMGNYFDMEPPANIADYAFNNMRNSQAAACVVGLIMSQMMLDINWCGVYHGMDVVRKSNFSHDLMRQAALDIIFEYIDLYHESCLEEELTMETEQLAKLDLGKMVTSLDYFLERPAYTKPAQRQLSTKDMYVDLVLLNDTEKRIYMEWINYNKETNGSDIVLSIKNLGNTASIATNLLISIPVEDVDLGTFTYYMQTEIPAIGAGKTIELTLTLRDYWIYDPDADFTIILDYDNNIEETKEDNNRKSFFEHG